MLSMRSLDSATVLYSNSYYTVVASIFLASAASCKAICEVTSVRTSDYSPAAILAKVTRPSNATRAHLHKCGRGFPALQCISLYNMYLYYETFKKERVYESGATKRN